MNVQNFKVIHEKNGDVSLKKRGKPATFYLLLWAELFAVIIAGIILTDVMTRHTNMTLAYCNGIVIGCICCLISVYQNKRATEKEIEKVEKELEESDQSRR